MKSAPSNLSKCKILQKNPKMHKFGTKIVLFGYSYTVTLKNCCYISSQHLQTSVIPKFCEETKMPKVGTTKPYLVILDQKCFIGVFSGINVKKKKKQLSYLKPTSSISSIGKISKNIKILKFMTKSA